MDDHSDVRAYQADQWAGIGLLAVYLLVAWAGIELLSPALSQELAVGIFAVVGVFVAVGAIKFAGHVAARRRRARPRA